MKTDIIKKLCFQHIIEWVVFQPFTRKWKDDIYIELFYYAFMGKKLNLRTPKTFNEKLQWLKLHDRKPIYSKMADKYGMKEFVTDKVGKGFVIPNIGIWDSFEQIDFDQLPDQFVLKTTHDSGGIVICKDKKSLNLNEARKKLENSLRNNYYFHSREWPYRDIPRKIIAEKYLDNNGADLDDFKIHCFNGTPQVILVCRDRYSADGLTEDFFDINWNHLDVRRPTHPNAKEKIHKPDNLEKMIQLSKKLSENVPFLRVDFYEVNGAVYVGELTFFPASGVAPFIPDTFDLQLGELLKLDC